MRYILFLASAISMGSYSPDTIGEMYVSSQQTITIENTSEWTAITTTTEGITEGVTFGSSAFTVIGGGTYEIHYSVSSESVGTNKTFEYGVTVGGVAQTKCTIGRKHSVVDRGAIAGTCVLALSGGDVVRPAVQNVTDDTNIKIDNLNFTIIKQ